MPTLIECSNFPILFPLCNVREVSGNYVTFCLCPATDGSEICHNHKYLKDAGRGTWDGLEVSWWQREDRNSR